MHYSADAAVMHRDECVAQVEMGTSDLPQANTSDPCVGWDGRHTACDIGNLRHYTNTTTQSLQALIEDNNVRGVHYTMTQRDFVDRIRVAAYESSVAAAFQLLVTPPGRQPSQQLIRLSTWFNALSEDDRDRVREAIVLAARAAVFQTLSVIDGATSVREEGEVPGTCELRYGTAERMVLLNDPTLEPLHEMFASIVQPL